MSELIFRIPGPLLGYRASAARCFDPKWKAFKRMVRLIANTAGVPSEATETMAIDILIRWKKKARIDGSNVTKGLVDALWKQDRKIASESWVREQNTGIEEAVITVRR